MKCKKCGADKLSKEFPSENVTDKCDHLNPYCLRCMVNHGKQKRKCLVCNESLDVTSTRWLVYEAILDQMFGIEPEVYTELVIPESAKNGILNVTTLTGEFVHIPYDPEMTIADLKDSVKKELSLDTEKENLKLTYMDREIKIYKKNKEKNYDLVKIKDYDIPKNSKLQLIVLLYTVSSNLKNLVFDITWEFPRKIPDIFRWIPGLNYWERDHVDATCFTFEGSTCMEIVDAETKKSQDGAVLHSGSKLDPGKRTGKQSISINVSKLNPKITNIFFTLSARDTPVLSKYPNPRLSLYDESDKSKSLCSTGFKNIELTQALIMCSLSLNTDGLWEVYNYSEKSAGNIKNYSHLKTGLEKLAKTFFSDTARS